MEPSLFAYSFSPNISIPRHFKKRLKQKGDLWCLLEYHPLLIPPHPSLLLGKGKSQLQFKKNIGAAAPTQGQRAEEGHGMSVSPPNCLLLQNTITQRFGFPPSMHGLGEAAIE